MMSRCVWLIWKRLARVARIVLNVRRLIPVTPALCVKSRWVMTYDPPTSPAKSLGIFFVLNLGHRNLTKI